MPRPRSGGVSACRDERSRYSNLRAYAVHGEDHRPICVATFSIRISQRCSRHIYLQHGTVFREPAAKRLPAIGSVVSKVQGLVNPAVASFIGLAPYAGNLPYGSQGLPGFLGVGHTAFRPSGPAKADMVLSRIFPESLQERASLFSSFDNPRRTSMRAARSTALKKSPIRPSAS